MSNLSRFFKDWETSVSSAEWCTLQYWMALWRSLIWIKKKEVVQGQNLVVHHNQPALNQNYIHWLRSIVPNLTSKTGTSYYICLGFHNILICAAEFYDQQCQILLQVYNYIAFRICPLLSVRLIRAWLVEYFNRKQNCNKYIRLLMYRKLDSLLYMRFSMTFSRLDRSDIEL